MVKATEKWAEGTVPRRSITRFEESAIRLPYEVVASHLGERGRRLWAASEARAAGRGGVSAVSRITGIARSTINRGLQDLERGSGELPAGRVRRSGGGRKAATV